MAFENLTLFELNFNDSQFGPASMGRGAADVDDGPVGDGMDEEMDAGGSGGRRAVAALAGAGMAVAVAFAVRRYLRRRAPVEIEAAEPVEIGG